MADMHVDERHEHTNGGGMGAVGIVAIVILVLLAAFFVFRAVGTSGNESPEVNVSVPLPSGESGGTQ